MKTRTPMLAALILVVAAAAWAQPGPGPRGRGGDEFPARLLERMDLTEAQSTAIAKIRDEARERGRETRKQMMRLRHELQGIMMQVQPDAAAAEKLIEKMGELRTEQQVRRMQTRLAVRDQLTPEQRDRMPLPGEGPRGRGPRADRSGPDDGCGMRADGCRHPSGGRGPGTCDGDGPHGPRGGNR